MQHKYSTWTARTGASLVICSVFGLLWFFDPGRPAATPSIAPLTPTAAALVQEATAQAQQTILWNLLTPAHARFRNTYAGFDAVDNLYFVFGDVESQNVFGTMLQQDYAVYLRFTCAQDAQFVTDGKCWSLAMRTIGSGLSSFLEKITRAEYAPIYWQKPTQERNKP